MKLSIITINLNNKVGLEKTILSVLVQTYEGYEWIVIDGGSRDGSKEVLEKYSSFFSIWESRKDSGIYDAMNKGIKYASGEYILFLNSGDTLISPHCLKEVLPQLKNEDLLIGYEISNLGKKGLKFTNKIYLDFFLINYSLPHQATFIKKKLFLTLGLYDERLMIVADWWFFFKAILQEKVSIRIIKTQICFYDNSGISTRKFDLANQERIFLLNNTRLTTLQKIFFTFYKFKIFIQPFNIKIFSILKKFFPNLLSN